MDKSPNTRELLGNCSGRSPEVRSAMRREGGSGGGGVSGGGAVVVEVVGLVLKGGREGRNWIETMKMGEEGTISIRAARLAELLKLHRDKVKMGEVQRRSPAQPSHTSYSCPTLSPLYTQTYLDGQICHAK